MEITITKRYDEQCYDVIAENENVCISGVLKNWNGNYEFEPSWFADGESEKYWDDNWDVLELTIIEQFYEKGGDK